MQKLYLFISILKSLFNILCLKIKLKSLIKQLKINYKKCSNITEKPKTEIMKIHTFYKSMPDKYHDKNNNAVFRNRTHQSTSIKKAATNKLSIEFYLMKKILKANKDH